MSQQTFERNQRRENYKIIELLFITLRRWEGEVNEKHVFIDHTSSHLRQLRCLKARTILKLMCEMDLPRLRSRLHEFFVQTVIASPELLLVVRSAISQVVAMRYNVIRC